MKKIVTDKDRIKELESQINELQDILNNYLIENDRVHDLLDNQIKRNVDVERENSNLKHILHYNTIAMIILDLVERRCSYTSDTETAFSTAIKKYKQEVIKGLNNISKIEDIEPYYMDGDDVFGDENEGENGNEETEE